MRHNPCATPRAHPDEPRLSPHLRALVSRRGTVCARLPRQDLRRRDRGRADRRGQAQPLRAGHGDPARDGHQARAGARLSAAGQRAVARQGARVEVQPRPAHHRRGGARLRAGGRGPVALRDRGGVLAGAAQHADGQRDGARGVGQLPHRAPGGHRRRQSTSSRAASCARSMPAAMRRAIDIGAVVLLSPFGFSPTGEAFNLSMEDVATSTAIALQADKLLFLTEVPGIREDRDDPESAIDTELALADAERLLAALPAPTQPTDDGVLSAALREGLPRRRRALAHPAVRGGRRAADGGLHARRHRHDGGRREAREPARGDAPTTSAASCS